MLFKLLFHYFTGCEICVINFLKLTINIFLNLQCGSSPILILEKYLLKLLVKEGQTIVELNIILFVLIIDVDIYGLHAFFVTMLQFSFCFFN